MKKGMFARATGLAASIVLAALILSCSQSGTGPDVIDDEDGIAPSTVLDLSISGFTDHTVTLTWTAPGDDSTAGTAAAYYIKYSTVNNLWSDWDSAAVAEDVPDPLESGTVQSVTVGGLATDSTYYFALQSSDEAGNYSFISNVVSATCLNDFVVVFEDENLEAAIRATVGKSTGDLLKSDLILLTSLVAENSGIGSLSGLEHCTNLERLILRVNNISDIGPLAPLVKLNSLDLVDNDVTDITALQNLQRLTQLTLTDNMIAAIDVVAGLHDLDVFQAGYNRIADISALENLEKLTYINIGYNEVDDLSPLVENAAVGSGTTVILFGNPLSFEAVTQDIPALLDRGADVLWDVDTVAPSAVTDLRPTRASSSTLTLAWTAPGDDMIFGTADLYDVRFGTDSLVVAGWTGAFQASGAPRPGEAGTTDSITVDGLMADTTYYFALKTRDESGNWSDISNIAAGEPFEDFVVVFPDAGLEAAVRAALGEPSGDIYRTDLFTLHRLDASGSGINSLSGLQYCVNMDTLGLSDNSVSDIGPLASMTGLRRLDLSGNAVVDAGPLSSLGNLSWLDLDDNSISDLAPLAGLGHLYTLYLRSNDVSDLGPLAGLTALGYLFFTENAVSDLEPLSELAQLRYLEAIGNNISDLSGLEGHPALTFVFLTANHISDLAPLSGLTAVTHLYLDINEISDLGPIEGLGALENLSLQYNQVVDVAPLVANSGLAEGDQVWLQSNPLSEASINVGIPALEARGVTVYR
jgi:Leucine-rich repeat (LRR) protein